MRRAPSTGYTFATKRDYRRRVWAAFRDGLKDIKVPIADSHALLMPSIEGDEIEVAMNAGFREEHLHVVDVNPAIVATLKKRHRKINTYGVTASAAVRRISEAGIQLHAANFDFCGQLSKTFIKELLACAVGGNIKCSWDNPNTYRKVSPHGAFAPECFVGVTMLRGRESTVLTECWATAPITKERLDAGREELVAFSGKSHPVTDNAYWVLGRLAPNDRQRVAAVKSCLEMFPPGSHDRRWSPDAIPVRSDYYKSTNGQTMLWSVWRLVSCPKTLAGIIAHAASLPADKARGIIRSVLLDDLGRYDDDGKRIWMSTLAILKTMAQLNGLDLSEREICDYAESLLGRVAAGR